MPAGAFRWMGKDWCGFSLIWWSFRLRFRGFSSKVCVSKWLLLLRFSLKDWRVCAAWSLSRSAALSLSLSGPLSLSSSFSRSAALSRSVALSLAQQPSLAWQRLFLLYGASRTVALWRRRLFSLVRWLSGDGDSSLSLIRELFLSLSPHTRGGGTVRAFLKQ